MDPTTQPRVDRPVHSIHLMGICGTGMGTLAAMLQEAGYRVRGSDQNVYPPMSTLLASKGIHLIQGYRSETWSRRPISWWWETSSAETILKPRPCSTEASPTALCPRPWAGSS